MIEVDGLTKVYGNRVAVWKVSFNVARGEILGFLGPNGAGKTTTMRMLCGYLPPSSGTARVAGHDVIEDALAVKARLGYLCEAPPVYREMVVRRYLDFVAEIKKVERAKKKRLIERAIELCGLQDVARRAIGHLSKGYRQRVGLAQAILHEPEVLVLDEPTVGLDPRQIRDIRSLICELAGEQTVVLSTHILPEVTRTCTRVVVINEGQIVAEDSIENLTHDQGSVETLRLRVARDAEGLTTALAAIDGVTDVHAEETGRYRLRLRGGAAARERLAAAVVAGGAGLIELTHEAASLEEVFLNLVTEEDEETEGAA